MGMEFDTLEVAGKGRPVGFPVMTVSHDDGVIAAPLRPLRPGKIHLKPAVGQPLDLSYGGIEGEVRANAEVIDVGFEVLSVVPSLAGSGYPLSDHAIIDAENLLGQMG